jgi:hypothetical protein
MGLTESMDWTISRMRRACAAASTTITMFCWGTADAEPKGPTRGLICSTTVSALALESGMVRVMIWSGGMVGSTWACSTWLALRAESWMEAR